MFFIDFTVRYSSACWPRTVMHPSFLSHPVGSVCPNVSSEDEDRKLEQVLPPSASFIGRIQSHGPQVKTGILHSGSPVVVETAGSETRTAASPFTPRLKLTKLELKLISLLITRGWNEEERGGAPPGLRDGVWDEGPISGRLERLSNVGTTRTSRLSTSGRFKGKRAILQTAS